MADPTLLKKIRLLAGQRALLLNSPAGYLERLSPLPEGAILDSEPGNAEVGRYDFVQVFVRDSAELARLAPAAQQAIRYDGVLWISYPKRSAKVVTDLSRDRLWELMQPSGLNPVTQVAIDDVWSALRFRPAELVGR